MLSLRVLKGREGRGQQGVLLPSAGGYSRLPPTDAFMVTENLEGSGIRDWSLLFSLVIGLIQRSHGDWSENLEGPVIRDWSLVLSVGVGLIQISHGDRLQRT